MTEINQVGYHGLLLKESRWSATHILRLLVKTDAMGVIELPLSVDDVLGIDNLIQERFPRKRTRRRIKYFKYCPNCGEKFLK